MKYFLPFILLVAVAGCKGESDGIGSAQIKGLNSPAKIAAVPSN